MHGLSYREAGGRERRVDCDAVVISLPPSPAFELLRQTGVKISFRPELGYVRPRGRAGRPHHCRRRLGRGRLVRPGTADEAAESGRRAARGILAR